MSVYDVATLGEKFDIVLFMGVMYHLRYPLLALELWPSMWSKNRSFFNP